MPAPNPFGGPSETKPSSSVVEYSGKVDAWRMDYLAEQATKADDTGRFWNGPVASIYPRAYLSSPRYNSLVSLSELRQSKVMNPAIDELDFKGDDAAKEKQRTRLKTICAQNASGLTTGNAKVELALTSLQDTMNGLKPGTKKWGPKSMAFFGAQRMEEEIFRTARGELVARQVQEKQAFEEFLAAEGLLASKIYKNQAEYDLAQVAPNNIHKLSTDASTGEITCITKDRSLEGDELQQAFDNMQHNEMLNCDKAESKARTMFQDSIEYNKDWAIICAMQNTESFNAAKAKQKKRCEEIIDAHEAEIGRKGTMLKLGELPSAEVLEAYEIRDGLSDALPSIEDFDDLQVTLDNHVQGSCSFVMKISQDSNGGLHLAFEHDPTKGSIENRKDVYEAVDRIILAVLCRQRQKNISVADAKIKLEGGSDEMIRVLAAAAIARGYQPENIMLLKNGQKADMPEDIKKRAQRVRSESLVNAGTVDEVSNRMDYAVQLPALKPELGKAETAEEVEELQAKYTMEYDRANEALKAIANADMGDDQVFSEAVLQLNKLAFDPTYTRLKDNWGRRASANTLTAGLTYGLGKVASTLGVLNTNPFALRKPTKDAEKEATYKPLTAMTLSKKDKSAIQEAAKKSFVQLGEKHNEIFEQFNARKIALSSSGKTI